jgi:hypothetical protein
MAQYKLLTVANPKTLKGEAHGYMTAVLHLAPANVAGYGTVCPFATEGCMFCCLNTAGRGGIMRPGETTNAVQEARKRRTAYYKLDRYGFADALAREIEQAHAEARRHGLTLAVRVNGTSDLPGLAIDMATRFPNVQFYDYTKVPIWKTVLRIPANLHYTFSRSEGHDGSAISALLNGYNLAVVFSTRKGQPLPSRWCDWPVIDGDATDLRFLDPRGVVVGLRAKGRAKRDTTGFVVQV